MFGRVKGFSKVLLRVLLFVCCGVLGANAGFRYNVSIAQMATCKDYVIPSNRGYSYNDFFHIHSLDNNKLQPNELLHLKFYVMTSRDAHILLSVTSRPRLLDRVYEVVIGAGLNTFSTIRTSMGRRRVATNQEAQILSMLDPTPIEIVQTKDANLLVFIPGYKEEPLMNFTDALPLNINYISFTTYDNTPARWFYDCQFDGFDSELEEEVRPLTPQQRLIANVTAKAENASQPAGLERINFAFHIHSVAFRQDESILQTRLNLVLYWNDVRLQWNPEDFDGMDTLVRANLAIWTPEIVVLNGALDTLHHFVAGDEIKLFSNGTVSLWASNAQLNTWCLNSATNWPHEQLDCELALGVGSTRGALQLVYDNGTPLSPEPFNTLSEWQFSKIVISRIQNGVMARITDSGIMQSMEGDLSIVFHIRRNGGFYKNVFGIPIVACEILLVLSFLLRGYCRGALILVAVFITMMGLMFITRHAPPCYIPDIMVAYQHVLRSATACYLLHIVLMWLEMYPPKSKPHDWLVAILNCSPLRLVLCMRLTDSSDFIDLQMQPWREIAKMLNAICFIGTSVAFVLIDAFLLPKA